MHQHQIVHRLIDYIDLKQFYACVLNFEPRISLTTLSTDYSITPQFKNKSMGDLSETDILTFLLRDPTKKKHA